VDELGLSDTVGYASPKSVKSLIRKVRAVAGDEKVKSVHLHNTYGLGIANAFAAYEEGIEVNLWYDPQCGFADGVSADLITQEFYVGR